MWRAVNLRPEVLRGRDHLRDPANSTGADLHVGRADIKASPAVHWGQGAEPPACSGRESWPLSPRGLRLLGCNIVPGSWHRAPNPWDSLNDKGDNGVFCPQAVTLLGVLQGFRIEAAEQKGQVLVKNMRLSALQKGLFLSCSLYNKAGKVKYLPEFSELF